MRNESPRNITPRRLPIHIRVVRAFFHSGGLNAGTPFETASTPVTAGTARREGVQDQEDGHGAGQPRHVGRDRERVQAAGELPEQADPEQREHHQDEEVGRDGEHPPGLPHAAQVAPRDEPDEEDRQPHAVGVETRRGRRDGGDARRDRHRDREHVVGEQRDPGDLRRQEPEVVLRHDVGAAGARVRLDRLAVREEQDAQDARGSRS